MHQPLRQAVTALVRQPQPRDRIEGIALLRPASPIAPLDNRNAFRASMFRHGAFRFEFHVEGAVEPAIEHLIAHRQQRLIARRIANLREHRERPMRTAPRRVNMRLANEPPIPSCDQRPRARRRPDFFPQLPNFPRLRIFPHNASHHLPSNRRLVALQQRLDDSSSIAFHNGPAAHSDNSKSIRSNACTRRIRKGALRDFKTGTGGAYAPLSEILPTARDARSRPESKVARRAQLCAYHWVQGSPLPPAAQAIILLQRSSMNFSA